MNEKCDWCGSTQYLRQQGTERNMVETLCANCASEDSFAGFLEWTKIAEKARA